MIFPGQGSQTVGMGKELASNYPPALQVFQAVDDALGVNLSELIWDGKIEDLTLTENAQPALMANSMALLAVLETEGLDIQIFDFMAGHSLGEYSALCAAKAISLQDTAKLLRRRGVAMQSCVKPSEGAMAAILGLSAEKIEEILGNFSGNGVCQIANDNDPNQVVISGHQSEVNEVIELTKKNGARRALKLNVSAPFHCQIMAPAAEVMKEALADVEISKPKVPIVMNTLAKAVEDPEYLRTLLYDQIVGTVRWRESVSYMHSEGITNFYEVGPGKVLSGMIKRIEKNANTESVSSAEDILVTIESLKHANIK